MTLREQVAQAIHEAACCNEPGAWNVPRWHRASEAALVVFTERERLLRERIEALRDAPGAIGSNAEMIDLVLGVFE